MHEWEGMARQPAKAHVELDDNIGRIMDAIRAEAPITIVMLTPTPALGSTFIRTRAPYPSGAKKARLG